MLSDKPFVIPEYLLQTAGGRGRVAMAVAGADHSIIMESTRLAVDAEIIKPTLIGDPDKIRSISLKIGWDISNIQIVASNSERASAEAAVALARGGEVNSIMKGYIHTDVLMRATVAKGSGLRTDRRLSHVFHMTVPGSNKVLYVTDAAINVAPNADTLIHIINNAAELAKGLGNSNPQIALLSATELALETIPSSVIAENVVNRASNGEVEGAVVDGPFALDNAISHEAAKLKGITGSVAGNADILVVPNIEMGNGLFKMMVYFMSGLAAGIVMGASVPMVLTSRADPPEARFAATLMAAIMADRISN